MTTFNLGDVVRLKSGGPKMTIDDIRQEDGDAVCAWFDDKNSLQTGVFSLHLLDRYEPPSMTSPRTPHFGRRV